MAVLLAAKAVGVDLDAAAGALAFFTAQPGRGQRLTLAAEGCAIRLDESYNANPASMRAAFELAGALPLAADGRRIAALGDMLELGPDAPAIHASLAEDLAANHFDRVFAAGPLMKSLYDALPASMRGGWSDSASDLKPVVAQAVKTGDIVVVKGSNGSKMSAIVAA